MRSSRPGAPGVVLGLVLAATVLVSCRGGEPPAAEEGPQLDLPRDVPVPPPDPARVHSISPGSGAPGTDVTLRAGGLPPGSEVEIGFGAPNTNFEILGRATVDSAGEISTTLAVPDWAEPGRGYMFVVALVNQPPRAASDTFRVTPPEPR
jgi:hypothetical protein